MSFLASSLWLNILITSLKIWVRSFPCLFFIVLTHKTPNLDELNNSFYLYMFQRVNIDGENHTTERKSGFMKKLSQTSNNLLALFDSPTVLWYDYFISTFSSSLLLYVLSILTTQSMTEPSGSPSVVSRPATWTLRGNLWEMRILGLLSQKS